MRTRSDVIAALSAAVRRVYGTEIEREEHDKEVAWALIELQRIGLRRDVILWRKLALGRRLFDCLGEAQNWRCCYCGVRMLDPPGGHRHIEPSLEHVQSSALGGPDHPDNLAIACTHCNQAKGRKLWELLHPGIPFIPRNLRRA